MMSAAMNTPTPRGRVATSQHMDCLVVTPIAPTDRYELAAGVRALVGTARLDAGGLVVAAHLSPRLVRAEALDLVWTEEALRFAENRRQIQAHHAAVRDTVERIKAAGSAAASHLLRDLDDIGQLDGHQLVNVAAMTVPNGPGLCVFDEQGAGKTVTLIFAFDLLVKRNEADLAMVIAPKSMVPEWPRDIARFKGDLYRCAVVTGGRREKLAALRRGADFIVTNFETAVALEDELTALARARDRRVVLAVDESFFAKNLEAKRTQAIRRLREWCGRAFVLCGTPAPNRPEDLVQQFNIVDFGMTFDGVSIPDNSQDAAAVVQAAVAQRGLAIRHLKRDVLPELPGKSFETVLVPLQRQQRRLYEGALRDLILDLRAADDNTFRRQLASFFARRMALLQICSHPGMIASGYDEVPGKHLALDTILRELIEHRREKVLVWSYFRHSLQEIVSRFGHYGAVRYDGSLGSTDDRREAVRQFQDDEEIRLFVANPAAAGAGLTLHSARVAIYESMSNQAAHYLQSLDRIHRRGQRREVQYVVLLADRSIELDEYDRLLAKERNAQALLGDAVDTPPTRERMLSELTHAAGRMALNI
jgi:SNF2 family DNA or RNA helicase